MFFTTAKAARPESLFQGQMTHRQLVVVEISILFDAELTRTNTPVEPASASRSVLLSMHVVGDGAPQGYVLTARRYRKKPPPLHGCPQPHQGGLRGVVDAADRGRTAVRSSTSLGRSSSGTTFGTNARTSHWRKRLGD
jgi:hypothetical protein